MQAHGSLPKSNDVCVCVYVCLHDRRTWQDVTCIFDDASSSKSGLEAEAMMAQP